MLLCAELRFLMVCNGTAADYCILMVFNQMVQLDTPYGLRPPDPPSLISLNMILVGHVTWKCILFSDLKTVEVFTIIGSENLGSVHYFRI